jgi:hypothetical protein
MGIGCCPGQMRSLKYILQRPVPNLGIPPPSSRRFQDLSAGARLVTLPLPCQLTYSTSSGSDDDVRLMRVIDQVPEELWGAKLALQVTLGMISRVFTALSSVTASCSHFDLCLCMQRALSFLWLPHNCISLTGTDKNLTW